MTTTKESAEALRWAQQAMPLALQAIASGEADTAAIASVSVVVCGVMQCCAVSLPPLRRLLFALAGPNREAGFVVVLFARVCSVAAKVELKSTVFIEPVVIYNE